MPSSAARTWIAGGTLTLDHICYRAQELDRQRVPTPIHTQHIFKDSTITRELLLAL